MHRKSAQYARLLEDRLPPPTHIPNMTLKKIADFKEPSRNLPGIKINSCFLKKRNGMKSSSYTNSEQFVKIGHRNGPLRKTAK